MDAEMKARSLLAEELKKVGPETMNADGMDRVAESVLDGTYRFCVITAALRAIVRALSPPASAAVVPEGWCLVPLVPTEDMVVAGFESEPDACFSPLEAWLEYEAMTGCRQAAHRAKLCYDAMLAAAPKREDGSVLREKKARAMYSEYSGNHPTIHCNRFPSWSELTEAQRADWLKKAEAANV